MKAIVVLILSVLAIGGCGGDSPDESQQSTIGSADAAGGSKSPGGSSSGSSDSGDSNASGGSNDSGDSSRSRDSDGSTGAGQGSTGSGGGSTGSGKGSVGSNRGSGQGSGSKGGSAGSTGGGSPSSDGPRLTDKAKPDVKVATDAPSPRKLVTQDLVVGSGAVARKGDEVGVLYVGVVQETGKEFASNWGGGGLFAFELGDGSAVPGFERGIEGMRVGGRRRLVVPPRLGYGSAAIPPDIPRNATLVFVVDLLEVR